MSPIRVYSDGSDKANAMIWALQENGLQPEVHHEQPQQSGLPVVIHNGNHYHSEWTVRQFAQQMNRAHNQ